MLLPPRMTVPLTALLLAMLAAGAQGTGTFFPERDSGPPPAGDHVVLCKIEGEIDDGVAVVVERAVKQAAQAKALVFVVDTPGGRVDSAIEMTRHILNAPCPTYAYVEGMGAISAGALVSYACDYIVMGPASNIGASTPIMMGPEGVEAVGEKSMSFVRAKYRALGEEKGHNPLIGEAMVDSEIALYGLAKDDGTYVTYKVLDGKIVDTYTQTAGTTVAEHNPASALAVDVPEAGLRAQPKLPDDLPDLVRKLAGEPMPDALPQPEAETKSTPRPEALPEDAEQICDPHKLLTLTTEEAIKYRLSPFKADTIEQLLARVQLEASVKHYVVPTFAESLFAWLTSPLISGLLLMLGVGALYVEMRTPGLGLAGAVGAACLALFFGSYLVLGLANWIDILLVAIGIGLLIAEIFFIPGFGIAGISGMACMLAGFYLAMVRVPIPQYSWEYARLDDAVQTLTTSGVLLLVLGAASWKLFPHTPFAGWLVLNETQPAGGGYVVESEVDALLTEGTLGTAVTMLRPAGKARFGERTLDVVTRGEFLAPGCAICVIRIDGNRHVVAAARQA